MNRRVIRSSALIVATLVATGALAAPLYTITDLPAFDGPVNGRAFQSNGLGINASGQITGSAGFDMANHAFVYDGTMHDLGTLGGAQSTGSGINDNGQVTGYSDTVGFPIHPRRAFFYDGTLHDIGTLGSSADDNYSLGYSINDRGQITGESSTISDSPNSGATHAFFYDGTMHDIGTLGGQTSSGRGINASGQITGNSTLTAGNNVLHAFFYDGAMHDIGTLGGTESEGNGINASGQITGSSSTASGAVHAFFYDGAMHDIGTLGGSRSEGFAINSSGQIVGASTLASNNSLDQAFVYDSVHGMRDLNDLIDPRLTQFMGWGLETASGINDRGQITGYGVFRGNPTGFILTPVPEPSGIFLLALGATALLCYQSFVRRRSNGRTAAEPVVAVSGRRSGDRSLGAGRLVLLSRPAADASKRGAH